MTRIIRTGTPAKERSCRRWFLTMRQGPHSLSLAWVGRLALQGAPVAAVASGGCRSRGLPGRAPRPRPVFGDGRSGTSVHGDAASFDELAPAAFAARRGRALRRRCAGGGPWPGPRHGPGAGRRRFRLPRPESRAFPSSHAGSRATFHRTVEMGVKSQDQASIPALRRVGHRVLAPSGLTLGPDQSDAMILFCEAGGRRRC